MRNIQPRHVSAKSGVDLIEARDVARDARSSESRYHATELPEPYGGVARSDQIGALAGWLESRVGRPERGRC